MNARAVIAFVHPGMPPYIASLKLKLWPAYIEYAFDTTRVAANLIYHGVMARYPNINVIASGWLKGEDLMAGRAAVVVSRSRGSRSRRRGSWSWAP